MGRIRKSNSAAEKRNQVYWRIGKYLRLSREAEGGREESESITNQNSILDSEIPRLFQDGMYEVVDSYVDDGVSGTTDYERQSFQRMLQDIKIGKINCVIVKNLSRAFRNSADQTRFLEEFLPLYRCRFISLYEPALDTYIRPDAVDSLEVPITGLMNQQYALKTSLDVRRTFKQKRESGEFIGAFAPFGYSKDPNDKNALVIDEEAAQVVRDIFTWFIGGMSKIGIAKRLNELGIANPSAYKRSKGFRYENPHAASNDGMWSPSTVSRILQNPLYIGTLRQGQQKVISYKVHRRISTPENEWFVVNNAVPPVIDRETFETAQTLHQRDTRAAPGNREVYLFSGFVRCAGCHKGMARHSSKGYTYYSCRTYIEKSKERCSKHSIRLDVLERTVLVAVQKQIELVSSLAGIVEEINNAPVVRTESTRLNAMLKQKTKEFDKVKGLLDDLYMDWKSGDITRDQYRRMKIRFEEQMEQLQQTMDHIKDECETIAKGITKEDPYLAAFLKYRNIQTLSRGLLVELVNVIYIHENGEVEIEFNFADQYRRIVDFIDNNRKELYVVGKKAIS